MLLDKTKSTGDDPKLSEFGNYPKEFVANMDKFMMDLNVSSYYTYQGSITEPPCTEDVQWILVTKPLPMHTSQAAVISGRYKDETLAVKYTDFPHLPGFGNNRKT